MKETYGGRVEPFAFTKNQKDLLNQTLGRLGNSANAVQFIKRSETTLSLWLSMIDAKIKLIPNEILDIYSFDRPAGHRSADVRNKMIELKESSAKFRKENEKLSEVYSDYLDVGCTGILLKSDSDKKALAKVIADYNNVARDRKYPLEHSLFPLLLDILGLIEQGTDKLIKNSNDRGGATQSVSRGLKSQLVSELAGSYEISFTKCPGKSKTSPFSKYIYAVGEIFNFSIGNGTIKPVISK
jgi:hypothetical protein